MATPARLTANRQNAILSTGPRTPEGKAVACQNARTHGLLSRQVLLPDENRLRLIALRAVPGRAGARGGAGDPPRRSHGRLRVAPAEAHAVEAGVFQGERDDDIWGPHGALGYAFHQATETFAKLARYEAALERAFYRALHELQRLQAARAGQAVPPPVAVDVDITVAHLDDSDEGDDA